VASDPTHPIESQRLSAKPADSADPNKEFERLRKLLLGKEQVELRELTERFEAWGLTPEEVAEQLPEAIALRTSQDDLLGRALAPTLEEGISESVDRNPHQIAQAIYPILGPAIRKAISETISGFVETLNRAIEHSMSIQGLKWRFEAWRTGVPYAQIVLKYALVYQVEQAFLIHAESGLLLAHVALDEKKSQDPDLVSGMLTAIRDFVGDSFDAAAEDGLRTFSVGELTVMVESGPRAMLAAVVRGQAPAKLYEEINEALEDVHLQMRAQLKAFQGDTEPFEAAKPTLEELLETVVETDRPQSRSVAPKIAWAVAGVVALLLVGLAVRGSLRWNEAVRTLRAEPGIVLIDADRSWGSWRFEGLHDPLARDPLTVLEEAGFDPDRVEGSWEPYMSFDEEMVYERAVRVLEPPETATVSLSDGVLRVEGAASARWVIPARQRARSLSGISRLDMSGLSVTVPPDLRRTSGGLESHRVFFSVGSADLTPDSQTTLDLLAADFERLAMEAGDIGYRIAIDIVGRTDSSGTEELNRALSEQRAQAVLGALAERGIEPDEVRTVGLGVSDPLSGADEEDTARLNRSVSFVITLTGWDDRNENGE
jgi:OOP family OmpA-OmpF porin